ncbi:M42 family metallopeptidase [Clostridium lundense]|uniref:M42 family metallopeptidase n=1 Tax=Clostridium lundense TaxID=319475 RepID=UPI00048966D9|nr:hydrolase [Clostridium lundense]
MDKLLSNLVNAFGVSGNEDDVRNIIKDELKDTKCIISEDKIGNLIVKLGKGQEKMMFCAHMDTIGFMVSFIEDNGLIRVEKIGEFNSSDVVHNIVRFKNGTVGKLFLNKEQLFIDIGINTRKDVLKLVNEGDTACLAGSCLNVGEGNIISSNLDNRVGCYILLSLAKELQNINRETYFVFSTQNELGARGARAAAHTIKPDYCIVVDLEGSEDVIEGKNNIKLGKGPIIKVMDKTLIMHEDIKNMIEESAQKLKLKVQYVVSNSKSDGGTIHKEGLGVKTGELSVPCRYIHCSSEMINIKDIEDSIKLLKELA